jgi:adenosylcobinamide-GDP ribazoletransferase
LTGGAIETATGRGTGLDDAGLLRKQAVIARALEINQPDAVAHTACRWTVLPLCAWLPYARAEGQGKLVAQRIGATQIIAGTATLVLMLGLLSWVAATLAAVVTGIVVWLCGRYFRARLQGLTGDCLGAANQLTEVALYLLALVLLRWGWL